MSFYSRTEFYPSLFFCMLILEAQCYLSIELFECGIPDQEQIPHPKMLKFKTYNYIPQKIFCH